MVYIGDAIRKDKKLQETLKEVLGLDSPELVKIIETFEGYNFHPEIEKVSVKQLQYEDYRGAILNACIEVINRVKKEAGNPINSTGKELDGDDLMNKSFGWCDGRRMPLVKLNSLENDSDKSEQRGFLNLFKGICGVRNKKAHMNFIQPDRNKAIEYLALCSLLMRLLDNKVK